MKRIAFFACDTCHAASMVVAANLNDSDPLGTCGLHRTGSPAGCTGTVVFLGISMVGEYGNVGSVYQGKGGA